MARCALCGKPVTNNGSLRTSDGRQVCWQCVNKKNIAAGFNASGNDAIAAAVKSMTLEELRDYQYYDAASLAYMKREKIVVSTGPIDRPHEVIGPVFFCLSSYGASASTYARLTERYKREAEAWNREDHIASDDLDWGYLWGQWTQVTTDHSEFDLAFYIAIQELRYRAAFLGGDAVVNMSAEINLNSEVLLSTTSSTSLYLQVHGTAVKFIDE